MIVFVGEKRSKLAVKKGVTWQDWRLAAKTGGSIRATATWLPRGEES